MSVTEDSLQELEATAERIAQEEAEGDKRAFTRWLHQHYAGTLGGSRCADLETFSNQPLTLDMAADWDNDCPGRVDQVELLAHIQERYAAEDFDEQEHFDHEGTPILPYGDGEHFDQDGKPIPSYVLVMDRVEP